MIGLPRGWERETLGSIADWSSGGTPKAGTAAYYGGEIPWAVIGDLNDRTVVTTAATITEAGLSNSSARVVTAGTVLIAMYGSIGKLGIAGLPMATNQAIACAVPVGGVSREWLFWWLRGQRAELLGAGKGGTQANISQTVLKSWPIPVAPLAEQERIVTAIEEAFSKLDAGEAGLRTVGRRLTRMRQAVLAAAVTGHLVPQDPTDTPAAKLLADLGKDALESPELPKRWALATVHALLEHTIGGVWGSDPGSDEVDVNVIRVTEMSSDGRLDPSTAARRSIKSRQLDSRTLQFGDVLLEKSGGGPTRPVGRVGMVRQLDAPSVCANFMQLMRADRRLCIPEYLELALRQFHASGGTQPLQTATTNIRNLKMKDYFAEAMSLPPPEEQHRIVTEVERQFSFIEACERAVDTGLARSAALRRSTLKAAFDGRLVPQDPSDEPASVLLERIRAERSALSATAKPLRRRRTVS